MAPPSHRFIRRLTILAAFALMVRCVQLYNRHGYYLLTVSIANNTATLCIGTMVVHFLYQMAAPIYRAKRTEISVRVRVCIAFFYKFTLPPLFVHGWVSSTRFLI